MPYVAHINYYVAGKILYVAISISSFHDVCKVKNYYYYALLRLDDLLSGEEDGVLDDAVLPRPLRRHGNFLREALLLHLQ